MGVKKAGRFFLKLGLVLAALGIVLIVLAESGIAFRYLLGVVGNRMGLELSAEKIKVGTGGHLRVRRFSAAFVEEESPFFTAHNIEITMNQLADLLVRREAGVSDIRLVGPVLTVRSDEDGRLNIAPLLTRNGKKPERTEPLSIPSVSVINGTVRYERFGEKPITVSRIQFDSFQPDEKTLGLSLSLPGQNTLAATLHRDTLIHSVTLHIEDVAALPDPAKDDLPRTFRLQADWKGQLVSDSPRRLVGELDIRRLALDSADASVQASIVIDAETVQARLRQMVANPWPLLSGLDAPPDPLSAASGSMVFHTADRRVVVEDLHVLLLGGDVRLDAELHPQAWTQSRGGIVFNLPELRRVVQGEMFEDASLSGSVQIGPAADRRAMEPMAVELKLRLSGDVFETAGLQEISANGYLGATRLVTNGADIPIFEGSIQPWVSLTRREGELFTHVIADVKAVKLERVVQSITGRSGTIPGLLSGTIRCRTSGSLQTLSGSADIALTESDLMNTSIIGAVHSAMNLAFREPDAKGRGTIKIAAHGETVEIMSFEYYNRGVEVRGAGSINSVTQGRNSPVSGFVTGSMQPLRDIPIPGTRDLDRLISGLQAGLATVRIEGTLGEPAPRAVPLPEVHNALRGLLWEQLRD